MNSAAVDRGVDAAVKINVPESWKTLADDTKAPDASLPHYIREIQIPSISFPRSSLTAPSC